MADPDEGVAPDGTITTGARRERVPAAFEPVLGDAVARIPPGASLYVYGSVANGTALIPTSDIDLLSIDLPGAPALGDALTVRYAGLCRGVEVAAASTDNLHGDSDEAYGNRVFLRHYCVHLAGPDPSAALPRFPADARAARGFNGDLARHLRRWRESRYADPAAAAQLGTRIARKTLLAVAGLVSVHDGTWTTDRARGARRWGEIDTALAADLERLLAWVSGDSRPSQGDVEHALTHDGVIDAVVQCFRGAIGLWAD